MPEEITEVTEETTEKQEQAKKPEQAAQTEVKQANYEELFATDKALQSFVDKAVTKATQTAVQNALQKQQPGNIPGSGHASRGFFCLSGFGRKSLHQQESSDRYTKTCAYQWCKKRKQSIPRGTKKNHSGTHFDEAVSASGLG